MGNSKKEAVAGSLLRRMAALEATADAHESVIGAIRQTLDAIVASVGADLVREKLAERARFRIAEETEANAVAIDDGLRNGYAQIVEKVGEQGIVKCSEHASDGSVLIPQRYFFMVEEGVKEMVGQAVGFEMRTHVGTTLKVLEIYEYDAGEAKRVMDLKQAERDAAEEASDLKEESAPDAP